MSKVKLVAKKLGKPQPHEQRKIKNEQPVIEIIKPTARIPRDDKG
jgi:hypothetical protein